jgi:hypothetical protein
LAALSPLTRAAAIDGGAAAAIGYGVAMVVLRFAASAPPTTWWRHVTVVGAFLVALSALAAAADRLTPARAPRPAVELLGSVALGALTFLVAFGLSELVVARTLDLFVLATAVLGAGVAAAGWSCRFVLERPGGPATRVALVLALSAAGALLGYTNYLYAWNMTLGNGPGGAEHDVRLLISEPVTLAKALLPACLAVALPALARAISWGLPAQVIVGMTGTAAAHRALDLRGLDWHMEGVPMNVEVLAGCLVPVACALAAHRARRARPDEA